VPADRAATGRDTEADTSAKADTSTKADASTRADALAKADAATRADAVTRAEAPTRAEAADQSDTERREGGRTRSDAAGQGAEGAPAVQDTESHGTPAAGASVPEQEPTGAEPETGQAPDAKPHATEPSGAEPHATEPHPGHADERDSDDGDSGEGDFDGAPTEDAEAGADAVHEGEPTSQDAVSAPGPDGRPLRTTRRFPLFTRDTARPEGGGRAAARDAPAPARQWPILAVIGTVGLGLLLTALDVFRVGTLLIGVALLAGGVMRWMLPDVGMLAVRSRFTDLVTYGVLGVTIVLLAMMAQPNPLLEIPFLDDTLHFTIRT
jgi:hypothetical protein